jgi:hypothetical protein
MFIVVSLIDQGDNRTVGLMSTAAGPDQGRILASMTPDEARRISVDLLDYADR